MELAGAVTQTFTVGCVDDPDQGVGLLEVVLPVCAEGFLAADVPWVGVSRERFGWFGGQEYTDVELVSGIVSAVPSLERLQREQVYPS